MKNYNYYIFLLGSILLYGSIQVGEVYNLNNGSLKFLPALSGFFLITSFFFNLIILFVYKKLKTKNLFEPLRNLLLVFLALHFSILSIYTFVYKGIPAGIYHWRFYASLIGMLMILFLFVALIYALIKRKLYHNEK